MWMKMGTATGCLSQKRYIIIMNKTPCKKVCTKVAFYPSDRNTKPIQAVEGMAVQAKEIFILKIKIN